MLPSVEALSTTITSYSGYSWRKMDGKHLFRWWSPLRLTITTEQFGRDRLHVADDLRVFNANKLFLMDEYLWEIFLGVKCYPLLFFIKLRSRARIECRVKPVEIMIVPIIENITLINAVPTASWLVRRKISITLIPDPIPIIRAIPPDAPKYTNGRCCPAKRSNPFSTCIPCTNTERLGGSV